MSAPAFVGVNENKYVAIFEVRRQRFVPRGLTPFGCRGGDEANLGQSIRAFFTFDKIDRCCGRSHFQLWQPIWDFRFWCTFHPLSSVPMPLRILFLAIHAETPADTQEQLAGFTSIDVLVDISPRLAAILFGPKTDRKSTRLNSSHLGISY